MTAAQLAAVSYLAATPGHTHQLYAAALRRWFGWCQTNGVDPLTGIQRAHIGLYIRHLLESSATGGSRERRDLGRRSDTSSTASRSTLLLSSVPSEPSRTSADDTSASGTPASTAIAAPPIGSPRQGAAATPAGRRRRSPGRSMRVCLPGIIGGLPEQIG